MPDASHPRRVLGFLREQPAALAATWRALAEERPRLAAHAQRARQVVLVGSGTSKNALIATAPAFARAHRAPARVLGPLEFLDDDADLALKREQRKHRHALQALAFGERAEHGAVGAVQVAHEGRFEPQRLRGQRCVVVVGDDLARVDAEAEAGAARPQPVLEQQ